LEFVNRNSHAVEEPCIMNERLISPLPHIIKNGPDLFLDLRAILNFPLIHSLEVTFKSFISYSENLQRFPYPFPLLFLIANRNDSLISFFNSFNISSHVGQFLIQALISSIQMIDSRDLCQARRSKSSQDEGGAGP
jgi:hypothetical protein